MLSYAKIAEKLFNVKDKPLKYIFDDELKREVKKGDVDVELVLGAVSRLDDLDAVIVVSGDSDYLALRQYARERGKPIVFMSYKDSMAWELRLGNHLFIEQIRSLIERKSGIMDNKNPDFSVGAALMQSIIAKAIMESSPLPSGAVDNSRPQYLKHSDSGQVATVENGAWTKVAFLKEGMEIAVSDQGDNKAVWDGIAKIEILPAEQVYDIEVEGTHNFIGNDIVAHNTYIGGTASTTNLIVSGTAYLGSLNGPLQANNGLVSATTSVGAIYGGTGLDSSALTGIAQIVSGTWSASSTLSAAYGGTGWGNIQSNSILLGNGAGDWPPPPPARTVMFWLLSAGVPTWLATSTLSTITGTLAVAKGGTGLTAYTAGDVLYASGTGTLTGTSTANLKSSLALNLVENTALSTWAGSTNLTTLGTIGTGVWNGTTIAVANGGTGLTSGYNN